MKKQILMLKISFIAGAVLDLFVALQMIFFRVFEKVYGMNGSNFNNEYKIAIWMAASLMLGWTVLLIWGFFKPVERKGIILITIFPVVAGLVCVEIFAVLSGTILLTQMLKTWIIQALIIFLYIFSYIYAKNLKSE